MNLSSLASAGIIVSVDPSLYSNLKRQNREKAQSLVKRGTAHNDKLGFDYSVINGAYYRSEGPHFGNSAYVGFIDNAVEVQTRIGDPLYV